MTVLACSAKRTPRLLALVNGVTAKTARPAAKVPAAGAMPRARDEMRALVTAPGARAARVRIAWVPAQIRLQRSPGWATRLFVLNAMRWKARKWH